MIPPVHIGKIIQECVKDKRLSVIAFADQINCSPRNVYEIFKKQHIDTDLLIIISEKLGQNLFLNYLSEFDLMTYQHTKYTEELLKKITGSEELLVNIDTIYSTQDPLTIKLIDIIMKLQAEIVRIKG